MAKDKISDYDGVTAGNNTDIGGISIDEGMLPSAVNNSLRELTKQLGAFADGTDGIDVLNLHDDDASASIKIQAPATVTTTTTLTLPDGAGSSGQVLTTNGSGTLSWSTASGGISNVVEDTTPQLGGNLSLNGNDITGTGDISISGSVTFDGGTTYADLNFQDNVKATFGDAVGGDLQIYHDGLNSYIYENGTGSLRVRATEFDVQQLSNGNSVIKSDGSSAQLLENGTLRLETTSSGIDVTGTVTADGAIIQNSSAAGTQIVIENTSATASTDYKIVGGKVGVSNEGFSIYDSANATTAYYIDSSGNHEFLGGNVGIGTASPTQKLHVDATGSTTAALFDNNGTNGDVVRVGKNGTDILKIRAEGTADLALDASGGSFLFKEGGSEAMRIDGSGNVGIGTSNPQEQLQLTNSAGRVSIFMSSGGTNQGYISYFNATQTLSLGNASPTGTGVNGGQQLNITNSGNVGIGTTSPNNYSGYATLALNDSTGGIIEFLDDNVVKGEIFSGANDLTIGTNTASGTLRFRTASGSERMRIDSSGNVGIGTASPARTLSVYNSSAIQARFESSTTDSQLEFVTSGGNSYIGNYNGNMVTFTGGSERLRLDTSGNLLVGKTSASGSTQGAELRADGRLLAVSTSDFAGYFNRKSTDGEIVRFVRDTTTVGSIFSYNGFLGIGSPSGNDAYMIMGSDFIAPATSTGAARDAAIDLGSNTRRFKDLHLSGQANVGTAVAATQTASVTGSTTLNFSSYQNFILTMTGNITLANPTTEQTGQSGFIIFIHSGAARTVSLGTDYETAGGAGLTLSSASGAVDVVPYIVKASGSIQLGAPQLAFA